jgi:hypothetical protein
MYGVSVPVRVEAVEPSSRILVHWPTPVEWQFTERPDGTTFVVITNAGFPGTADCRLFLTEGSMCRNIKTLHNFAPPATEAETRASALQFVRKLSGFTRPSKANEAAFDRAVEQVTAAANLLLASLVTTAPPRDREVEAAKAQARSAARFAPKERGTAKT